jgi:hypothetical protein
MVERLFLNRINTKPGSATVTRQNDAAFTGLADKTKAALSFSQLTKAGAQVALNTAIWQAAPPFSLHQPWLDFGTT